MLENFGNKKGKVDPHITTRDTVNRIVELQMEFLPNNSAPSFDPTYIRVLSNFWENEREFSFHWVDLFWCEVCVETVNER